jgi:hypothetical protein
VRHEDLEKVEDLPIGLIEKLAVPDIPLQMSLYRARA